MAGIEEDDNRVPYTFSDSCLRIAGKLYHVECQSTVDGSILIRLVEYNMQIGLENVREDKAEDALVVELPQTSLLMLRSGTDGGKKRTKRMIVYRYEEQEIRIEVPVLHVQFYTSEDIYEKCLYFLIPYYTIRYEAAFDRIARNPLDSVSECDKIQMELEDWFLRLQCAYENKMITEDEGRKLGELSRLILNHITRNLAHETAERMVGTVGGKVLELQEDKWLKQGREEGMKQGRVEGMKQGRAEERVNTERERKRADAAEAMIKELEAQLASKT